MSAVIYINTVFGRNYNSLLKHLFDLLKFLGPLLMPLVSYLIHYIMFVRVLLLLGVLYISGGLSLGFKEDGNMMITRSCIKQERKALLLFKADLVETRTRDTVFNWGSEKEKRDCCEWVGVLCNNLTGHVIALDLSTFFGLVGKISPSLSQLHQLQYLNLNEIDFQSNPIPNFFGSLTNLRSLDISGANLIGPIPYQLGNLSKLLRLDLSRNFLVGSIPSSLGDLTSISHLDLSENQLRGVIPSSFGNSSSLVQLDLSGNLLNGSLPSFAGCSSLCNLSLAFNFLVGSIPSSLGDLTSISHLDLSENQLGGVIPSSFGNSSSLVQLNLSGNLLNGSLPSFAGCSSLCNLSLAFNSLNGSIPDFTGCPSLLKLDLSGNWLSGNLPNSVGQLSNLEHLDVSSNSLKGVISSVHFLNLTLLTYLDLSSNSFTLKPSSLLRAPFYLKTINLQSCKVGPSFPLWIKNQTDFTHLDISNAGISDSIPAWFWEDLPHGLKFLNLSSNEIKGMLPNKSLYFDGYPGMDLSNNHLEGRMQQLPSKLAALNLSGNKLSGNLSFLCEIDRVLTFLDLSGNLFSGSLPDCWLKFQDDLLILNLSNNNLSGEIPSSLGFLSHLESLNLRSNSFVGELPISLSNCTKLRFVDLGENKLSGIIPAWIGESLTELYVLVLRSNRFNGSLPTQVCWLYNLQLLDLSNNGLSGNIPGCFGNFTAMASRRFGDDMTNHSYSSYDGTLRRSYPSRGHSGYISYEALTRNLVSCSYYNCPVASLVKALFIDYALVTWKGAQRSFGRSGLQLLKSIDLSNNNLSGKLPYEITSLVELVSLNFSINKLHGELLKEMGRLKSLESLDLSRNMFSGHIPLSLSKLTFISYLDLSNNNLSGRIPTGAQLQRFNSSSYSGNTQLCGPPLTPRCGFRSPPATVVGKEDVEEDGDDFLKSYYMGMGVGFAAGFCGICGVLFLNHHCRYLFFASLSYLKDWIYVIAVVHFGKLQRKFRRF